MEEEIASASNVVGVAQTVAVLLFFAVLGALAYWAVRQARARNRELARREAEAADRFEAAMTRQARAAGNLRLPSAAPSAASALSDSSDESDPSDESDKSDRIAPPPHAAAIGVHEVLLRLEGLGKVASLEGERATSDGQGRALVVRLKNGQQALILPRSETPEVMERLLRGFDVVFAVLPGGEVSATTRYAEYAAAMIDMGKF